MTLFYCQNINGEAVQLDVEESRHLSQVLRLKVGQEIMLTNGEGVMCICEIVDNNPKGAIVKVVKRDENYEKRNYNIHIAVAPTKNIDRFEWFLEKATEIGIDKVTPLLCEHSERKVLRIDRAEKVILSAVKQSLKAYIPQIEELTKFKQFLESVKDVDNKFIAHCDEDTAKIELKSVAKPNSNSVVLIGPEGDFSIEEVALAKQYGFKPVSLGKARLRTETAALYATTLFAIENI